MWSFNDGIAVLGFVLTYTCSVADYLLGYFSFIMYPPCTVVPIFKMYSTIILLINATGIYF